MQTTNIFCNLNKNASMPVMPSMPSRPAMQNKNPSLPSRGPIIERYEVSCNNDAINNGRQYIYCENGQPGYGQDGKMFNQCYDGDSIIGQAICGNE